MRVSENIPLTQPLTLSLQDRPKLTPLLILLCLMSDNFTHQGRALGGKELTGPIYTHPSSLTLSLTDRPKPIPLFILLCLTPYNVPLGGKELTLSKTGPVSL